MIPKIDAWRYMERVHSWALDVFPGYVCLSLDECAQEANGIGADDTPEWLRDTLGVLLPHVREAAFLHDLEGYYGNDGTRKSFEAWNSRFRRNIKAAIRRNVSAWRVVTRWTAYRSADACYLAVSSDIGWQAWRKAYERGLADEDPGAEQMGV
jgi:hypothetical protein